MRVLEIRVATAAFAVGQEEIPEASLAGFYLEFLDERRYLPSIGLGVLEPAKVVFLNGVDVLIHERPNTRQRVLRFLVVFEVH